MYDMMSDVSMAWYVQSTDYRMIPLLYNTIYHASMLLEIGVLCIISLRRFECLLPGGMEGGKLILILHSLALLLLLLISISTLTAHLPSLSSLYC